MFEEKKEAVHQARSDTFPMKIGSANNSLSSNSQNNLNDREVNKEHNLTLCMNNRSVKYVSPCKRNLWSFKRTFKLFGFVK